MRQPTIHPSDEELARKARDGDARAFEALVLRHFGLVFAIALGRTGRREEAEEVAQEVFLRIHLRMGDLRDPKAFGGWLRRVARSVAADAADREKRRAFIAPSISIDEEALNVADETVRSSIEAADAENRLREVLAQLPDEERELVLLHYAQGLTRREISERMGVDATTVGRRLERAVESLRRRFGDDPLRGCSALRPRRAAAVRTVALLAAVAAMPEGAKAALVASAVVPAQAAPAPAAATGFASLLAALLPSASQTGTAAGAIMMGNAKAWTVAGVIGAVAIGGGTAVYVRSSDPARSSAQASSAAVAASAAVQQVAATAGAKSATRPYIGEVPAILPPALGQDPLAGCWLGDVETPRGTIKFAVQVADTAPGQLAAAIYSPSHAVGLIAGTARRAQDGAVELLFPDISLSYAGRLAPDGSIEGTFTEVKYKYDVEFERAASSPPRMMPPAYTPIRMDDAALDSYAGFFGRSASIGMPVKRVGDHLVTELENRPKDMEIYPLAPDRFFSLETDMLFEFERDASGKVVRMAMVNDASNTAERTWYRKVK